MTTRKFLRSQAAGLIAVVAIGMPRLAQCESPPHAPESSAPALRDAAYWPFSASSPWNTSLGANASYVKIESPGFSANGGANLNVTNWSYPVFIASETDPIRGFYWRDSNELIARMRAPDQARADRQSDGSLIIINDAHDTDVEMWQARRRPNGDWDASVTVRHNLRGAGFYEDYQGIRAGGMSALGGLIRREELIRRKIPHVLAVAVDGSAMNRNAPGGNPFVWPASWADGGDGDDYGTSGNLYMGSLLAIPPEVDLRRLKLSPQGQAVAQALQDYGAYVVDQGSANIIYYVEPSAHDVLATSAAELGRLTPLLRVVTNNSPLNVGGGGTTRRVAAPAPPLPNNPLGN
ncbi:MAG: hypothetical protein WD845_15690 [Pirellulales bacterium]